ncbi:MAG TPA: DUF308 domain-containing protein [Kineosporiaceae bacterium]
MTGEVGRAEALRDTARAEVREVSGVWWLLLILGILWTGLGMFVLSYRVSSLAVVVTIVGVALLYGGITQLVVASQVHAWRWLLVAGGVLGVAAGITTFVWPGATLYVVSILVAWYLAISGIVHVVSALAGAKLPWWWTRVLLGIAELALGVWALRSWQQSLFTLVTLVGVWAICHGIGEIFAAFALRHAGRRAELLVT